MTFEELLECSASELEAMSDQHLLEFLGPCLKNCPPIDIQTVNEEKAKLALDKLAKKEELKQQRLIEKAKNEIGKATVKVIVTKDTVEKKKKDLASINAMLDMMKTQMNLQQPKNKL